MRNSLLALAPALLLAGFLPAQKSQADVMTFETASGAVNSNKQPVSAEATFTTAANSLTITLTNLEANPTDVAQLLSGLDFTISGLTSGTLTGSASKEVSVSSSGVPTLGTSAVSTGWVLQPGFELCDVCLSAKADAPAHLIIGPPAKDGDYTAANGSIAESGPKRPHNPFLNETATFDLSINDLTASDSISSVLFRFGTTYSADTANGQCTVGCTSTNVPEPGSLALFAAGLLGCAVFLRRRRPANR